ncbi:hypothetical protein LCGC14_0481170 [marine sediment metagenome]|uniref:Uncharacterized protein n=1 Tax=marine sediment metagenome TaxID=412755 RepID=A0A0F9VI52_9ZZZZ
MVEAYVYIQSEYDIVYRKKWQSMSYRSLPEDGRNLFDYLLTCPHRNTFGYFHLGDGAILDDLQWTAERLSIAWEVLLSHEDGDMVKRDPGARVVLLVNALDHNKPTNPNVAKKWGELLADVPHSHLIHCLVAKAKEFIPYDDQHKWLHSWLNGAKRFPQPFANGSDRVTERVPTGYAKPQSPTPDTLDPNPGEGDARGGLPPPPEDVKKIIQMWFNVGLNNG